jgi:hypothetical protein
LGGGGGRRGGAGERERDREQVYPPLSSIRNISLEIAVKVTSASSTGIALFIVALPAQCYIASNKMAIKAYVAVRVTSCVSISCAISRIPVYNITSHRVIASHDRVKSGKSVKSGRPSTFDITVTVTLVDCNRPGRAGPGRAGPGRGLCVRAGGGALPQGGGGDGGAAGGHARARRGPHVLALRRAQVTGRLTIRSIGSFDHAVIWSNDSRRSLEAPKWPVSHAGGGAFGQRMVQRASLTPHLEWSKGPHAPALPSRCAQVARRVIRSHTGQYLTIPWASGQRTVKWSQGSECSDHATQTTGRIRSICDRSFGSSYLTILTLATI